MTEIVTKKQLDQIIDQNRIGNFVAYHEGQWIALVSTFCSSKFKVTDCIVQAVRFILGLKVNSNG